MPRERSLIGIVAWRVTIFAVLAMALQAAIVFAHYYQDDRRLADLMFDSEAQALLAGFQVNGSHLSYALPPGLERYREREAIARIRLPAGEVLFSNCDEDCIRHLLPLELDPPDAWMRLISQGKPIRAAGGRTLMVDGHKVFVEIGLLHDTDEVMWSVIGRELADHMAVPMILMLVFTLGATLLSIRRALKPVSSAAEAAEKLDPLDARSLLSAAGMPREAAEFVRAVNRAFRRIGDVMRAQKLYTTALAHEVRVPLAAMKLDLANIADPRARKVDADIDRLAHLVTQITDLGRLEAFDRSAFEPVDLDALGRSVVEDMAPLAFDNNHRIGFRSERSQDATGIAALIEDAVRNLVTNAIQHTPAGTSIMVTAGPGSSIRVADTAGIASEAYRLAGAPGSFKSGDRVGIGLEIVRKIVALHEGELRSSVEPGRSTVMEIVLPPRTDKGVDAGRI